MKGRKNHGSAQREKSAAMRRGERKKQDTIFTSEESAGADHSASSGLTRRSEDDEAITGIGKTTVGRGEDLESLKQEEISGSADDDLQSVNYSDTDEDENEGLGDGNLGRSIKGV
jgi:hypothetical protein